MLKKSLSAVVLATLLSGCIGPLEKDFRRQYVYSEDLRFNTKNKVRYYSNKSLNSGLIWIMDNLHDSKREEAWLFTPPDNWLELGFNEKLYFGKKGNLVAESVTYSLHTIEIESAYKDEMKFIHIHRTTGDRSKYLQIFPSEEDYDSMISTHNMAQKHSKTSTENIIVTDIGATYFSLTESGREMVDLNRDFNLLGIGDIINSTSVIFLSEETRYCLEDLISLKHDLSTEFSTNLLDGKVNLHYVPKSMIRE